LEAEKCWRRLNSPHLVALVHAGVEFPDGKTRILPDMPEEAKQVVLKVQEDAADLRSIHNIWCDSFARNQHISWGMSREVSGMAKQNLDN